MGVASAVMGAYAVVALCTAVLNLWIFLVRRREKEHLWLAVSAMGIAAMACATAGLYAARDLAEAERCQLLALTSGAPVLVGFLRFTAYFLRVDIRRVERLTTSFILLAATAMVLEPGWMFTGRTLQMTLPLTGHVYVEPELRRGVWAMGLGLLGVFGLLIPLYWSHRNRIEHAGLVVGALGLWFMCSVNDLAVAWGLANSAYMTVFGYAAFIVAFTAILVRRFVTSMERTEASAELLQHLVEDRTQELRQKDLQLAHGSRMAAVGALAAGLAHEINNPIAFISANLNQLDALWKDPTAEEAFEEVLTETREGVERIRTIVSELLRLSRRGEGEHRPVDLGRVINSVLPIVRHEARNRARIETRLRPVPPVVGDDRWLGQVVLNLVVNALHAIPEGDPERNRVTVSTSTSEGRVRLRVSDTGTGIPPEVLPRIFDPFFTTKEEGKGTGLGLAVTHELVSRHRGRIDVESSERGSAFTVDLPAAPAAAVAEAAGRSGRAVLGDRR
jgi:signal transduction histidine kinase